jgi:BirA family biotin operon repressor/biotin-[acetyl-CoA-carboxylase] ligase
MFNLSNLFKIVKYNEIDSTNTEAIRLIQENLINKKTIILSNKQTNGRGKKDAIWQSPEGNIYLTAIYIVSPDELRKHNNFENFSLIIGLSLQEVINFYKNTKCEVRIKKPNDILIDEKKVAGILIEFINHKNMHYLIIGIGINWNNAPLETSDYLKKFLKIQRDEFIFHLMVNIDEKIKNYPFYYNQTLLI